MFIKASPLNVFFTLRAFNRGMSLMISEKDIARVHASLEVPVVVSDLLGRRMPLADDEAYALEALLSEMTAEKCLLTAACVARLMSIENFVDEALKVSLSLLADGAFDDYAPRYLAGLGHSMKPTCSGYAVYMQEDLENFADIFSMASDIRSGSDAMSDIALIFANQTASHAEAVGIADDLFDYDEAPDGRAPDGGKIILFPRLSARSVA